MTSFNLDMQYKKLAVMILLVTVIVVCISVFLTVTYSEDIVNFLKGKKTEEKVIALGDCADVNYISRYASNKTIFGTSYSNVANESGIYNISNSYQPLKIFVSLNRSKAPPTGYEKYSPSYIEGLIQGLVGLKEGQTSVINISAEKAFGAKKLKVGDIFSTKYLTASNYKYQLNQTVEVFHLTGENITLKWLNVQDLGNFTLPEAILKGAEDIILTNYSFYNSLPPYFIWENSSKVINITDSNVLIKITPTKTQNLTTQVTTFSIGNNFGFVFPDATNAEWNESKIVLRSSPIPGSHYRYFDNTGILYNITVDNVTTAHVNVSIDSQGKSQSYLLNRTIEFNPTYSMNRLYMIPLNYFQYIFGNDIQKAGYSLSKFAGERLLFEVTIVKVYKTS
jgi:FKBP-type peptidyl-prolyl cis-trans isomerase 2